MRASPVKLKHYHFTQISITPIEEFGPDLNSDLEADGPYPSFSNAKFASGIRLAESDDGDNLYILRVHLTGEPKEGRSFPYRFSIEAEGVLTCLIGDEDITARDLVLVNGAALLYSAMREILLSLTFRFPHGPMLLPCVNFLDLKKKRSAGSSPNTATQEPDPQSLPLSKRSAARQASRKEPLRKKPTA